MSTSYEAVPPTEYMRFLATYAQARGLPVGSLALSQCADPNPGDVPRYGGTLLSQAMGNQGSVRQSVYKQSRSAT